MKDRDLFNNIVILITQFIYEVLLLTVYQITYGQKIVLSNSTGIFSIHTKSINRFYEIETELLNRWLDLC